MSSCCLSETLLDVISIRCLFQVQEPKMVEVINDRTESYLRALRELIAPRLQMVMIVFPTSRDDRYSAVKKLCCIESPIPSQVSAIGC